MSAPAVPAVAAADSSSSSSEDDQDQWATIQAVVETASEAASSAIARAVAPSASPSDVGSSLRAPSSVGPPHARAPLNDIESGRTQEVVPSQNDPLLSAAARGVSTFAAAPGANRPGRREAVSPYGNRSPFAVVPQSSSTSPRVTPVDPSIQRSLPSIALAGSAGSGDAMTSEPPERARRDL